MNVVELFAGAGGATLGISRATGRRRATPFENARLQGFPDDFPFHVAKTKKARYRCIGNAVPPTLAEVVVRALVKP